MQWQLKKHNLVGIDEAGRGPLAGPVVAASVYIPKNSTKITGVDDSKKLSFIQRERIFSQVLKNKIPFSIGIVNNEVIDNINILNATIEAINQSVFELNLSLKQQNNPFIDQYLIDGVFPKRFTFSEYTTIIKGDTFIYSIQLASIIAKVIRDRIMFGYDYHYPNYNFKQHKGYGTKDHYKNIKLYGICPIHRLSFLKNIDQK